MTNLWRKEMTQNMDYNIAVIKGDGIGPEVVDAALMALDAVGRKYGHRFKYEYLLAGGAAIDACGESLPEETVKKCKGSDAVLLGAVGGPKWDGQPRENRPETAILRLREEMCLFANLRPAILYDELAFASVLRPDIVECGLDIMIVRELTGGIYFGRHGMEVVDKTSGASEFLDCLRDEKILPAGRFAYDIEQYSEFEIRRIAEVAFRLAMKRGKHITSIDKANVLESSRLWRDVITEVHAGYPEVKLDHMYIDNAAQQLIMNPKQFDVIVTSNMFGDILSDEASQIVGSIGMLPSASFGEGRFGLYEPIHGSAPEFACKDVANPVATILSVSMMLRYSLNRSDEADTIENAVLAYLAAGYRTPDILIDGKISVGTKECGRLIAEFIGK